MKPATNHQHQKRQFNLLLNEQNVQQARNFTSNLSATVDGLLAEFVERQNNTGDEVVFLLSDGCKIVF